ncbi:MAG TPA: hypothetical protein P5056_01530 [Candidatus Paceibacterota bacterium]|nr:hypothetical protein [Candidatus Paceibacterota bacterium]
MREEDKHVDKCEICDTFPTYRNRGLSHDYWCWACECKIFADTAEEWNKINSHKLERRSACHEVRQLLDQLFKSHLSIVKFDINKCAIERGNLEEIQDFAKTLRSLIEKSR